MHLSIWFLLVIVILGFIVLIRFFIKFNRRKQKMLKYVQHLSSPKEFPIIGSALRFFGKSSEGELKFLEIGKQIELNANKSNKIQNKTIFLFEKKKPCRNDERSRGIYGRNEDTILCMVWRSFSFSH